MSKITRRGLMHGTLAAAASGAALAAPDKKPLAARPGIKLAEMLSIGQPERCKLVQQLGVKHAIVGTIGVLRGLPRSEYGAALKKMRADYEAIGLKVAGVESHPVPAEKIKLGLPGRDEEIENYIAAIQGLAEAGIPLVCYNFMAGLGWYRTKTDLPERGGALTSEFNLEDARKQGPTQWGEVSEEKIWANIEYFLKAVLPVAEKVNMRMALHPDDPPLSPLRGIGRILTSANNYRKVLSIRPSPIHGVTFCQANFRAMGEDIEALAKEWCQQKKIFFVHFRDIAGVGPRFHETFHDNGPTDMARMLQVYAKYGFDGPMRPDHAPTLAGEANDRPGYAMNGKVFAFGYMKGIMDAFKIAYE